MVTDKLDTPTLNNTTHASESGNESESVGKLEVFGYGVGNFGYVLSWGLIIAFLSYFYTDIIGISAGLVGILLLVARVWDGVSDVIMGLIIDRTNSKHGKARPYVLWLCIPFSLSVILLFTVPNLSLNGKFTYALITYSFFILMYTAISIPMKTLLGQMTQDKSSRTALGLSLSIAFTVGTLVVKASAEPVASSIGGQLGWVVVAGIIAVLASICLMTTFKLTTERVKESPKTKERKHNLKEELKSLSKNKYWIIIVSYGFLYYMMLGMQGAEVYYAKYMFGSASYFSLFTLAKTIPGIALLAILSPFAKRLNKKNLAILGAALIIVSGFVKMVDPASLNYFLIGTACLGLAQTFIATVVYTMVNDTVDYGEWSTGIRTPGLANSSMSFGMKVGSGISGAIMGGLLSFVGYIGTRATQPENVNQMIIFLNMHYHIILGVVMLVIILFYGLEKRYPQIIKDLEKSNA
ncbi:MFS transporter [Sporosarcina sp. FSL K6-1522]|uniref:MFS transporter n=1 Tax=Sporosarcina sp. FSL K6-1522 TaxID=2921554 RepID=UPI00315B0F25